MSPLEPVDLRVRFGDRCHIDWEAAGGATRAACPEAARAWLLEVRSKYGVVYPQEGGDFLAAWTNRPRIGVRLRRLPFILTARSDPEVVVTFRINDAEEAFAPSSRTNAGGSRRRSRHGTSTTSPTAAAREPSKSLTQRSSR